MQIVEGWRNELIPPHELKQQIEQIGEYRLSICRGCDYNSEVRKKIGHKIIRPDEHCTNCGCTLSAKTKCLSCSCPIKKWVALQLDESTEAQISKLAEANEGGGRKQ